MKTRSLAKRMAKGQRYLARGKRTVEALVQYARRMGEQDIEIIEEKDGVPSKISKIKVDELGQWKWTGERLLKSTEKEG